jgi:hypothetical protein
MKARANNPRQENLIYNVIKFTYRNLFLHSELKGRQSTEVDCFAKLRFRIIVKAHSF